MDADFAELYTAHRDLILRYLLARVHDPNTAEDLASETFCRALAKWQEWTDRGVPPGAWLIVIARNLLADHWKAAARRESPCAEFLADERPLGAHRMPDPQESLEQAVTRDTVARALSLLIPSQRRCLELRFLQERTVPETAAALRVTHAAVKTLQYRALNTVRTRLTGAVA